MAEVEKDLVKTTVRGLSRAIILWILNQEAMSGYKIVKEIEVLTGQKVTSGVIYPLLYELEKSGCIAGKWTQKGKRQIKEYAITKNGVELLSSLRKIFEMPVKEVLRDFISEKGERGHS